MTLPPRPLLAIAALVLWFVVAAGAAAQGCDSYGMYKCTSVDWTYEIRTPEVVDPLHRFPTVVVLHDAGDSGRDVVDNERLIASFVDKGYAVLAPDGLKRRRLRWRFRPGRDRAESPVNGWATGNSAPTDVSRDFVMTGADGRVRDLEYEEDPGWYYYNIDVVMFGREGTDTDYLGRDEIRFLLWALTSAAENYRIDPRPVLIVGLGHGGSLVWQIACHAPQLARLLAPVGGAYWHELPPACAAGAELIHTHHRADAFWPFAGAAGSRRRYARTAIGENLAALLRANSCAPTAATARDDAAGATESRWSDCRDGGPVELILTDRPFAFQQWWLDRIHARLDAFDLPQPFDTPDLPAATGPRFSRPDAAGESPFRRPDAETEPQSGEVDEEAGSRFLRPDQDTPSRFKRPGSGSDSPFKRVD